MIKRISSSERGHFSRMYDSLRGNFPLNCTACPTAYKNELDYTTRTTELKGVTNGLDFGLGFLFFRNCACGTTLGLSINPKKWESISQADFITYLDRRTNRKVKKLELKLLQKVAREKSKIPASKRFSIEQKKIDREKVYESVLLKVRDEYNAYLREREHPQTY